MTSVTSNTTYNRSHAPSHTSIGSKRTSVGSKASKRTSLWTESIVIDMQLVKAVQKRVALLASAADLPADAIAAISNLSQCLLQQTECNSKVDTVVHDTSEELLTNIVDAQTTVNSRAVQLAIINVKCAASVTRKTCELYLNVATACEQHKIVDHAIDEASADKLFELQEDFRLQLEVHETAIQTATLKVRRAATTDDLQVASATVHDLLQQVEAQYRSYQILAYKAASEHPVAVKSEAEKFDVIQCKALGLAVPTYGIGGSSASTNDINTEAGAAVNADATSSTNYSSSTNSLLLLPEGPLEVNQVVQCLRIEDAEQYDDYCDNATGDDAANNDVDGLDAIETLGNTETKPTATAPKSTKSATTTATAAAVELDSTALVWYKQPFTPIADTELQAMTQDDCNEYYLQHDAAFITLSDDAAAALPDTIVTVAVNAKGSSSKQAPKVAKGQQPVVTTVSTDSKIPPVLPPKAMYTIALQGVQSRHEQRLAVLELERLASLSMPQHHDGVDFLLTSEELQVPGTLLIESVTALRSAIIPAVQYAKSKRSQAVIAACQQLQQQYVSELEDNLRQHWPRTGRLQVQCIDPRETELTAHKAKTRRFIRQFTEKVSTCEVAFIKKVKESTDTIQIFEQQLSTMLSELQAMTSIASLQGAESKLKRLVTAFNTATANTLSDMNSIVQHDPTWLLSTCTEALKLCRTFGQGGDYDDIEIQQTDTQLNICRNSVTELKVRYEASIASLEALQNTALQQVVVHSSKRKELMQHISLKDGLGKVYGAPKHSTTEQLRSLLVLNDKCSTIVDSLLDELQGLLTQGSADAINYNKALVGTDDNDNAASDTQSSRLDTTTQSDGEPTAATSSTATASTSTETAARITICMRSIRTALRRRAAHLECVPKSILSGMQVTSLPYNLCCGTVPDSSVLEKSTVASEDSSMTVATSGNDTKASAKANSKQSATAKLTAAAADNINASTAETEQVRNSTLHVQAFMCVHVNS
jgi:Domain of unknown function (DUF4455)